jgi:hypothetical protein
LGPEDRQTSLKIVDLSWKYPNNNNEKIKIKCQWGPSEFHVPFPGSPGPVPMYLFNPPLIGRPVYRLLLQIWVKIAITQNRWLRSVFRN